MKASELVRLLNLHIENVGDRQVLIDGTSKQRMYIDSKGTIKVSRTYNMETDSWEHILVTTCEMPS